MVKVNLVEYGDDGLVVLAGLGFNLVLYVLVDGCRSVLKGVK